MKITEVKEDKHLKAFVKFPLKLYRNSEQWVPSVLNGEVEKLHSKHSVFRDRFDWKLWIVEREGQIVGRIAGIIDSKSADVVKWGWWDVVNDVEVSRLLFQKVGAWAKERDLHTLKGPLGFTNLDKTGLLTAGFDQLPTIAEHYNHAYYSDHLVELGFEIASEYTSYTIPVPHQVPARISKLAKMLSERYKWNVHSPRGTTNAKALAEDAFDLMNASHAELEGHTVLSDKLAQFYIEEFLPLVKTEYTCFVYKDSQLIGFGIALPNYSKAFQKMKGKIWPFGWWQILKTKWWHNKSDLLMIGVHPEHRNKGVTACIFEKIMKALIKNGVKQVESNPELKENTNVQQLWSAYDPVEGKEWKTYQKVIP